MISVLQFRGNNKNYVFIRSAKTKQFGSSNDTRHHMILLPFATEWSCDQLSMINIEGFFYEHNSTFKNCNLIWCPEQKIG